MDFDLSTESMDMKSNEFLCRRLSSQSPTQISELEHISASLDLALKLLMAHYRIDSSYREHRESLVHMAATSAKQQHSQQNESFKFATVVKDFAKCFLRDSVSFLAALSQTYNSSIVVNEEPIISVIYLIEKLYLICSSCPYDAIMSIPLAKYYWNLICEALENMKQSIQTE